MLEHSLFERLPDWSNVQALTRQGIAVAQRQHAGWGITLYQFNNKFVELWEKNGVQVIGALDQAAKPLEIFGPYTDTINLPYSIGSM